MRKIIWTLAASAALMPVGALAQSNLDGRVGKLEGEMRAVQRKVFPGGAGQYLQPEVTRPDTPVQAGGVPATSAVADLTSRVTALEGQMASMTDQIEQNGYKLRQLQDQFDAYKRATDAKLKTLAAAPAPAATSVTSDESLAGDTAAAPSRPAAPRPTRNTAAAKPVDAAADTSAVAGVVKPSTGNAAEDDYMYGYRLWAAKQYPQAEAQLKKVVADYPKSKRASYAQNLLGRAYLDEGKPSLASMAFYDNYKKMPDGERAPDSLYYLAQALMKLNKPADACKVYGELTDVYGGKISSQMKADVEKGRTAAKCK
ncbi:MULTISPECIES: tetratricopeptide repeat protein [Sphingomonas]|uniref:tetratricopeptide repeat protein n=1 Tax=Sphingomonas TaxID=13687 RepID=UPI00193B4EFF|nr:MULTISPECIES: tetratricopeptide repeat protein [Sphingomonas]